MISLHRYSLIQSPGDLTPDDLLDLWGLIKAEKLVDVFFYDGAVSDAAGFLSWATSPGQWTYAAKRDGLWTGLGAVNGFSATGSAAFSHFLAFSYARNSFRQEAIAWHTLLREAGIKSLIGVTPACYGGTLRWIQSFGYVEKMRVPGALCLKARRGRITDAVVSQLIVQEA